MKINAHDKKTIWQMHLLGDHAILFSLDEIIDTAINAEVHAFNQFIQNKKINSFKDYIPSYHTLTIVYDIIELQTLLNNSKEQISLNEFAQSFIKDFIQYKKENSLSKLESRTIKVPVCYDLSFGIDLDKIALEKNKTVAEIIEIHTSKTYHVFCLGFMPGFAYMGKVEESIQMARHPKPRPLVNAGSVGIAGAQTGIYPKDAPGGWQIIGRTPITIFDSIQLALFSPGDMVSFYAITLDEFYSLQKESNHVS
jgi:inhibitor of KinA